LTTEVDASLGKKVDDPSHNNNSWQLQATITIASHWYPILALLVTTIIT
jgi:hypothetical protein